jgi:hypothetical protein
VVHQRDILPALISSPASASRWRISVDFQVLCSAAGIRKFQRIASPPSFAEAGSDPGIRVSPCVLDVISVDVKAVPARERRR